MLEAKYLRFLKRFCSRYFFLHFFTSTTYHYFILIVKIFHRCLFISCSCFSFPNTFSCQLWLQERKIKVIEIRGPCQRSYLMKMSLVPNYLNGVCLESVLQRETYFLGFIICNLVHSTLNNFIATSRWTDMQVVCSIETSLKKLIQQVYIYLIVLIV